MATYRYAVIGCGNIAEAHAQAYANRENVVIVAGAEPDEARRATFAEARNIPTMYADYRELLEKEQPDIVSVCTWPTIHREITVAAAESGVKAIHCEKPMAVGLGECKEMLASCNANGVKLVIGHNHRWDASANRAKELVREGAIGELKRIIGYCGSRDLLANGTHVVDQIRFYLDDNPVKTVMGQIDRPTPKIDFGHEVEHSAIAQLYFENGVRAWVEQGDLAPPPYAFELIGTDGIIWENCWGNPSLRVINAEGEKVVPVEPVTPKRKEADALLSWLEGGDEHPTSGANGMKTHEILMAIYESSRTHGAVQLPFEGDEFPLLRMIREKQIL